MCITLVIVYAYTKMQGQQNITTVDSSYDILKLAVIRVLKYQKPANLNDVDIGFYINRRPWIKLDLEEHVF